MPDVNDNTTTQLGFDELVDLLTRIFINQGVSEINALILAVNCASCERDGFHSHGIFRIPGYVNTLRSGWVAPNAQPRLIEVGPSFLRINANNGFAQPVLKQAEAQILRMLRTTGIAVVAMRDSHHLSALWPDIEPFAQAGYLALTAVSAGANVLPPGGNKLFLGTNPIAFASPVEGSQPLMFDFATSAISKGDLALAAQNRSPVPLGTGLDAQGEFTTDAAQILQGGLLPFGGHKGAALSMMIELLASALTGGRFSSEVDFGAQNGGETPKTGQLLLLIDPTRGANSGYASRVAYWLDSLRAAGQTRLPGDRLYRQRAQSLRDGIRLQREQHEELSTLARV